ncbi:MAG TPA: 2-C-methyl-D-erythritol 4-phosphate cytidylyltransferase [Gemmataceae bacterium]|nr:2-C-methyl-D-erythritol 4-phosphate cytidylyltransferase [Gemmataceae bacterium]
MPAFAVILPAAGKSSRFGGREKKPFANIDGRAVWLRTAEQFVNRPDVKQIILVISPDDRELVQRRYAANLMFMEVKVVEGGAERFDSVANALAQLKSEVDHVAVHDAVRPCAPAGVIDAVIAAAVKHGAAIAGIPVTDTLKRVDNQLRVTETVARGGLWQAQTPQAFRKEWLTEAYAKRPPGKDITDDAQLVEAAGHPVQVVPGSPFNLKITTGDDIKLALQFIKLRDAESTPKASRPFEDERFA